MAVITEERIDWLTEGITAVTEGKTLTGQIELEENKREYPPIRFQISRAYSGIQVQLNWKPEEQGTRRYEATVNKKGIQEIARYGEYDKQEANKFLKYVNQAYERICR